MAMLMIPSHERSTRFTHEDGKNEFLIQYLLWSKTNLLQGRVTQEQRLLMDYLNTLLRPHQPEVFHPKCRGPKKHEVHHQSLPPLYKLCNYNGCFVAYKRCNQFANGIIIPAGSRNTSCAFKFGAILCHHTRPFFSWPRCPIEG